MALETIDLQTGPDPRAALIVLHGLGADGNDFVPLVQQLNLSAVGPVRYVFPHAPMRPVTINGGYVMRAWYDIYGNDLVQREDTTGLNQSKSEVQALIARENARGIAASRIVLAGFSQGCAIALLSGLRHGERLAGLAGLSGYLPLSESTAAERSAANADVPIFLAHGRNDSVVPFERAVASRKLLEALSHPVEWHEYPIEHTVSLQEIADLNRWLLRVLTF